LLALGVGFPWKRIRIHVTHNQYKERKIDEPGALLES